MKTITKVLILLLALCMIIPCMAACNNKKDNNNKKPSGGGSTVTAPEGSEIEMPEIVDMGGYTYKAYVRDFAGTDPDAHNAQVQNGNNDYRCVDFWVEEANSTADVISYAVYGRNQQIENDYNCKIRQTSSNGDQLAFLVSALQNGDGTA